MQNLWKILAGFLPAYLGTVISAHLQSSKVNVVGSSAVSRNTSSLISYITFGCFWGVMFSKQEGLLKLVERLLLVSTSWKRVQNEKSSVCDKGFYFLKWSNQTVRGLVIGKNEEAESILSLWCSKTVLNTRVLEAEVSETDVEWDHWNVGKAVTVFIWIFTLHLDVWLFCVWMHLSLLLKLASYLLKPCQPHLSCKTYVFLSIGCYLCKAVLFLWIINLEAHLPYSFFN